MNEQLLKLFELRKLERKERKNQDPKIVSVCSGKGGTGKTFLTLNLGYKLSRLNKKVLVIDFDFNFSNLHLLLNLTSENPISNFFLQKSSFQDLIYKYNDNFHLIFGDSGSSDFPRISTELLEYFFIHLDYIAQFYDYVFLDSSPGADELILHQLDNSNLNLIVLSPEPTAVMDAYVLIKMITENLEHSKNLIIVNKAENKEEGEQAFKNLNTAVNHFLKTEIALLGVIEYDRLVYKSIVDQELYLEAYPNSLAAFELDEIARRFMKIAQMANNNQSFLSIL